ncbi:MAG: YcxB family protein [Armatimonadetes bacterium]|nr:YcxB family protein [Armatimonadota bacterium]
MRVEYDSTLEDHVGFLSRYWARSALTRRWAREGWRWRLCEIAVVVFLLVPGDLGSRFLVATVSVLVAATVVPAVWNPVVRRRRRAVCLELRGTDEPLVVALTLLPDCLQVSQPGVEYRFAWGDIEEIQVRPEAIDFYTGHGGFASVCTRAFGSPEEMERFVDLAKSYRDQAQGERMVTFGPDSVESSAQPLTPSARSPRSPG